MGGSGAEPVSPVELAECFAAVCDALLPGDGNYPSASLTGAHGIVADRLRARYGAQIIEQLASDLTVDGRAYLDHDDDGRAAALSMLQAAKPDFFAYLLAAAYLAYYATPPVIEAIRLDGHIYNDAPQPLGYELTPFSFTPGIDVPLDPKGSFKWTFQMERIDISSLADLELPQVQEPK
jgi:hypothetical protein